MWLLILPILALLGQGLANIEVYEAFTAEPISDDKLLQFIDANTTFWCTTEIQLPCNADEYRRIDGTCNFLKNPVKGAGRNTHNRFLPPAYEGSHYGSRLSVNGLPLPTPRAIRTTVLNTGQVISQQFTTLVASFLVFVIADGMDIHDSIGYNAWHKTCCTPQWAEDDMCYPASVPELDPVHRFSGIICMNMTKPITYGIEGCVDNSTTPERLTTTTSFLDLSTVYGDSYAESDEKGRLYEGGLLQYEIDYAGRVWPPNNGSSCFLNQKDKNETRCHNTPNIVMNGLYGIALDALWFYRNHNRLANQLAALNPSWDDDKLFFVAKDINIAIFQQILYYELLPLVFGRDNLLKADIIGDGVGFRDFYDSNLIPESSIEYFLTMRWGHTIQEGTLKLYNSSGSYYDTVQAVDLSLRTGFFDQDNHIEGLTQGSFRQAGGDIDHVIDPGLGERVMGFGQKAEDVAAFDLDKGRLGGLQPYVKYLELCNGKTYSTFEDLLDVMDKKRMENLQNAYQFVEDIDLIAGIWSENLIEGGNVPLTFWCIVKEQWLNFAKSDRHWFERSNRPNAFTEDQLAQIRNYTNSRLLCDNGDTVTEIQPHSFLRIGDGNEITSCDNIPALDLSFWEEPCYV